MTISMLVKPRDGGECIDVPVCTMSSFNWYWAPGAEECGLRMIPLLGALWVDGENRDEFLTELSTLRSWALRQGQSDPYIGEMVHRIDAIRKEIVSRGSDQYEFSFG